MAFIFIYKVVLVVEMLILAGLGILSLLNIESALQNIINRELIVRAGGALFDIWSEPPIQPIFKVTSSVLRILTDLVPIVGVCVQRDQPQGLACWQWICKAGSARDWSSCVQVRLAMCFRPELVQWSCLGRLGGKQMWW